MPARDALDALEGREYEAVRGDVARARALSIVGGAATMALLSATEGAAAFPAMGGAALAACIVTGALRVRSPRVFLANAALAVASFLVTGLAIVAVSALRATGG